MSYREILSPKFEVWTELEVFTRHPRKLGLYFKLRTLYFTVWSSHPVKKDCDLRAFPHIPLSANRLSLSLVEYKIVFLWFEHYDDKKFFIPIL